MRRLLVLQPAVFRRQRLVRRRRRSACRSSSTAPALSFSLSFGKVHSVSRRLVCPRTDTDTPVTHDIRPRLRILIAERCRDGELLVFDALRRAVPGCGASSRQCNAARFPRANSVGPRLPAAARLTRALAARAGTRRRACGAERHARYRCECSAISLARLRRDWSTFAKATARLLRPKRDHRVHRRGAAGGHQARDQRDDDQRRRRRRCRSRRRSACVPMKQRQGRVRPRLHGGSKITAPIRLRQHERAGHADAEPDDDEDQPFADDQSRARPRAARRAPCGSRTPACAG